MKRVWSAIGILALVLALAASGVLAQESPQDKLKRGIELYGNQKYQEALEVLKEVDASQLPEFEKDKPALYMKKAEEGLAKQKDATGNMAKGEQALVEKKYATALKFFEDARKRDYLSEADERRLESLITVAKEDEAKARSAVLTTLQEAKKGEAAGDKQKAISSYTAVLAADVNLPAADKDFAQKHLASLKGEAQPPAETPKVAKTEAESGLKPVVTATELPGIQPKVEQPAEAPKPPEGAVLVAVQKPAEPITPAEVVKPAAVAAPVETPKPAEPVAPVEPAKPIEVAKPETAPQPAAADVAALEKQATVARELAAAKEAFDANDLNAAKMHYRRALAADPESQAAQVGLEKVEGLLGQGTRSLMAREADTLTVAANRIVALVRGALAAAEATQKEATKPEDFNEALNQLKYASRLINESRFLSPELAEDLREEVKLLETSIDKTREERIRAIEAQQAEEITKRERKRIEADRETRDREKQSLWSRAMQLADVRQYTQAAAVLDDLMVIDPQHERARRFREDFLYLAGQAAAVGVRQERRVETRKILADVEESVIPWEKLYRFIPAKDWAELSDRRKRFVAVSQGESEIKAAVRRKLATKGMVNNEMWSIPLEFTSAPLGSVLDFIIDLARAKPREINIVVDRKAIQEASVDLEKQITLSVKDVSVEQALKLVLGEELTYAIQDDGTVLISTKAKLSGDLPVRTYFVGDLITPIPDYGATVPRMTLGDVLSQGTTGGGGGGAAQQLFQATPAATTEEVSGTTRLKELIERTCRSDEPWESAGGKATLDFYERSGLMIVTQTDDGHRKLGDLLDSLRRERAIMISVEARFITVSDNFINDVTVDIDFAFNNLPDTVWGTPSIPVSDVNTLPGLPVNGIAVGNTMSNMQGTSALLNPTISTLFGAGWSANEGGIVISGVFLDDMMVGFLIRAIQADSRSTTLFAPRLTLWNGQRSWLSDGMHYAYVSDLVPIVAEAAVAWDPTISYLVSGSVLDVRATASADRRYVQLDLQPQVALDPNFDRIIRLVAVVPFGPPLYMDLPLPTVRVTSLATTVSVPDGGTLLIGGMKRFSEADVETGVPVLSKVPILKRIFSNRAQARGHQNLLVLIKPTIIIQAEEEAKLGLEEGVD